MKQRHVFWNVYMYIETTDDLIMNHDLFLRILMVLYNYTKYTQPPGYPLSMDRTISDKSNK